MIPSDHLQLSPDFTQTSPASSSPSEDLIFMTVYTPPRTLSSKYATIQSPFQSSSHLRESLASSIFYI